MALDAVCKCGKLRFSSGQAPVLQLICHCQDCRDATGHDASSIAFFKKDAVDVAGETIAKTFTSARGNQTMRVACAECDTVLIDKSDAFPTLIGVITDHIAPPFQAAPSCHVWTRSRLPHVRIGVGLPEHLEGFS